MGGKRKKRGKRKGGPFTQFFSKEYARRKADEREYAKLDRRRPSFKKLRELMRTKKRIAESMFKAVIHELGAPRNGIFPGRAVLARKMWEAASSVQQLY